MAALDTITHAAERQAVNLMLNGLVKHLGKTDSRTATYVRIANLAERFIGNEETTAAFERVRSAVQDPENRWMKVINRIVDETDPNITRTILLNLGFEAFLNGTKTAGSSSRLLLFGCKKRLFRL